MSERPNLTHTVKLEDGKTKEIKMSYGLFMDLNRLVPDPQTILETIIGDPITKDMLVRRCFTDTKKSVLKFEDLVDDVPINDPDEIDALLQWIAEHLMHFFAKSTQGLKALSQVLVGTMKDLQAPSSDGSKDSASLKPTAGPSDAVSQTSEKTSTGDTASSS